MKKLFAAVVLLGTLGMTGEAMAYGFRQRPPVYLEYRGGGYEFGAWIMLPLPRPDRGHWERGRGRERGRWRDHRRHGRERPRFYYGY